jgi:hypothetical protein
VSLHRFLLPLSILSVFAIGCGESNSETGIVPTSTVTTGGMETSGPTGSAGTYGVGGSNGAGGSTGAGGTNGAGGSTGTGGSTAQGGAGNVIDAGQDAPSSDGARCVPSPVPTCDAAPPDPGAARPWHGTAPSGDARHRGRDEFYVDGTDQWLIGRFAYGLFDSPIVNEEVDIYLLRGCGSTWEKLGTVSTTQANQHPAVEGVSDDGGRVFFQMPAGKLLGPGRHRIRFVVAGDLTAADLYIEHVPRGMPMFVSDMDGTLTVSETAETTALLTGTLPAANTDAAKALGILAAKGYRPFYLTARAEWLTQRSRDFLRVEGFPPGILRVTSTALGVSGAAAAMYKTVELATLAKSDLRPAIGFGNTDTDAQAYNDSSVAQRIFYQFTDTAHNGRRIEAYTELLGEFGNLPTVCP